MKQRLIKSLSGLIALVLLLGSAPLGGLAGLNSAMSSLFSLKASAATSGIYTYTVSGGKATITSCDKSASGTIIIPSVLGGCPVTGIGEKAFSSCNGLKSITTPNSVMNIGRYAFAWCFSLTSVTIGTSVTKIGGMAFENNKSLKSIIVAAENNVFSSVDGVLFNKAKTVIIQCPGGKTGVYSIPNSVTVIGAEAFSWCHGLTNITIPNSVTHIGAGAFEQCDSLSNVIIPNSITNIGGGAFEGCDSLTNIIIPNGVTKIGAFTFRSCVSLTNVTIPNSVSSIGRMAFDGCEGLKSIIIPNSVMSIGERAFYESFNLASITFPNTVSYIGPLAFDYTKWLDNQPDGLIYIGKVAYRYKGEMPINTSISLKTDTLCVSGFAFYECANLTNITIPNSVTNIGRCALYSTGLTSIAISDNVTKIGTGAFAYTTWYDKQPDGLIYAGKVAYNYKGLMQANTSIVLKSGTLGIGDDAFDGCAGLTSITIPNSVTNIGDEAFDGCKGLTRVTIPNSVTNIGDEAFYSCTGLTRVTIPSSVTNIGDGAFYYCRGLTSITIPNSVMNIGYNAFNYCDHLTIYCLQGSFAETYAIEYGIDHSHGTMPIPPAIPTNTKAVSVSYNSIKLTWSTVAGATGYVIYRYNPTSKKYEKLKATTATSYTNISLVTGRTYYYKVFAYKTVNGTNVYSSASATASAKPIPAVPTNFKAVRNSSTSIKLTWSPVTGASGFVVYKYNSTTKTWARLKVLPASSTIYISTGLTKGVTYYYKVRAYRTMNGSPVYGNPTAAVSAKTY